MVCSEWSRQWAERPQAVALVSRDPDGAEVVVTGGQLEARTRSTAAHLSAAGVVPGDPVLVSGPPTADTVIATIALLRLGATVVPVNTAATAREIAHVVAVTGAQHAIAQESPRFGIEVHDLATAARGHDGPSPDLDGDDAGPAFICFTSGTTGVPKGVPISHAQVRAGTQALRECWHWTAQDVLVSALPLFHVHGLIVALAGSLGVGSTLVLLERFEPGAVAGAVEEHSATLLFGVPTMWALLDQAGVLPRLRRLRLAVSGSAPLPPTLFARIAEEVGSAPVERYGMTETLIITSTPVVGERRAGTVGTALPGMEVRIAADGVVEVRGESVFAGYVVERDGARVRDSFTPDDWFRTGDIGEWDDAGNLRLVGRASELIITGGYNVYPREVEDVLRGDPRVRDVAVVGVPDATWGEVVAAVIVADDDAAVEEWSALCAEQLAPYKAPRRWQVVDELPRTALGKVQREVLRERLR